MTIIVETLHTAAQGEKTIKSDHSIRDLCYNITLLTLHCNWSPYRKGGCKLHLT